MLDSCIKKNILVSQYDVDHNKYFRNKMTVLDWICHVIQTLMDVKKIFQSYSLLNINVLNVNHIDQLINVFHMNHRDQLLNVFHMNHRDQLLNVLYMNHRDQLSNVLYMNHRDRLLNVLTWTTEIGY